MKEESEKRIEAEREKWALLIWNWDMGETVTMHEYHLLNSLRFATEGELEQMYKRLPVLVGVYALWANCSDYNAFYRSFESTKELHENL